MASHRYALQDMDKFSLKDSGRGDSEAGDSDCDMGRESPVDRLLLGEGFSDLMHLEMHHRLHPGEILWCNPPLQPMSLCKMTPFPVLRHLHNSMTRRQSADLHTQHLLLQQLTLKYCFTIQSIIAPQFYCTLQKLSVVGFWLISRLASLWVSWNGHFPLMILEIRDSFLSSNWKWATTETSCLPADRT